MLDKTHSKFAPWTVVKANDKRRLRIAVLQAVVGQLDYDGKDAKAVGKADQKITGVPSDMI
jgi:polyphosphate kinase